MSDVGKMSKGTPIPHAPRPPRQEGVPHRAPDSAPAPTGRQHEKETHNTVGKNTGRVR